MVKSVKKKMFKFGNKLKLFLIFFITNFILIIPIKSLLFILFSEGIIFLLSNQLSDYCLYYLVKE